MGSRWMRPLFEDTKLSFAEYTSSCCMPADSSSKAADVPPVSARATVHSNVRDNSAPRTPVHRPPRRQFWATPSFQYTLAAALNDGELHFIVQKTRSTGWALPFESVMLKSRSRSDIYILHLAAIDSRFEIRPFTPQLACRHVLFVDRTFTMMLGFRFAFGEVNINVPSANKASSLTPPFSPLVLSTHAMISEIRRCSKKRVMEHVHVTGKHRIWLSTWTEVAFEFGEVGC